MKALQRPLVTKTTEVGKFNYTLIGESFETARLSCPWPFPLTDRPFWSVAAATPTSGHTKLDWSLASLLKAISFTPSYSADQSISSFLLSEDTECQNRSKRWGSLCPLYRRESWGPKSGSYVGTTGKVFKGQFLFSPKLIERNLYCLS